MPDSLLPDGFERVVPKQRPATPPAPRKWVVTKDFTAHVNSQLVAFAAGRELDAGEGERLSKMGAPVRLEGE